MRPMFSAKVRTMNASYVRLIVGKRLLPLRRQRCTRRARRRIKLHCFWSSFAGAKMCTPSAGTIINRKNPGILLPAETSGNAASAIRKNTAAPTEPPQIVRTAQKTPPKQGYEILSNILAPKFHRCQFCFSLDTLVVVEIDIIVNQFSSILESLSFHSMYTLSL